MDSLTWFLGWNYFFLIFTLCIVEYENVWMQIPLKQDIRGYPIFGSVLSSWDLSSTIKVMKIHESGVHPTFCDGRHSPQDTISGTK